MIGKFFLCYFETTRECILSCPYCMTRLATPQDKPELTTDEAKHLVLDEVRKYAKRASVAFSGGEFLVRHDALELLRYNASLDMWAFVNTCGENLTRERISDVKKAANGNLTFVFSLDSVQPENGAVTRQGKLKTIEENKRICRELDIPFFFVVTISKSNLHELGEVLEYATQDNTPVLRSPMVPRGGGENYRHLMFDKSDMENTIHPLLRNTYLSYISFTPFLAAPRVLQKNWLQSKIAIKQLGCQAGRGYIGISPEGDVAPCVHLLDSEVLCGNVRTSKLSNILTDNPILDQLRTRKTYKGKCGRCKYRNTCGGCRALAYHHTGDFLAEDPTCFYEPDLEKRGSVHEELQNQNLANFARFVTSNSPWRDIFNS